MVAANPTKGAPVTGPEHYRKAEQLIEVAEATEADVDAEGGWRPYRQIQLASVHATLALAAGAALGTSPAESHAWAAVAGVRPDGSGTEPASLTASLAVNETSAEVISKPLVSSPAAWAEGH
jgi:hypothetical protein